ncbi:anti-sigma factor family protein [Cupriavidus plantarum]|uniref:anti-sigma factor family protein n=1 Tax=Cupriavidus plantarum TaxID=942865 RepID=UPI000E24B52A|nr:anti-sigma factor [Cupriavidus plantarum]REF02764.1 anti-sigma factor RsiW [Cupriavidus plantarum]
MNDQRPTGSADAAIGELELHAYVDGELPGERRAAVERALEADPALVARVDDYLSQKRLLHARYDAVLDEAVPRRLWPAADARPWSRTTTMLAMAAMLALGVGIGIGMNGVIGGGAPRAWVAMQDRPTQSAASQGELSGAAAQGADSSAGFARRAALAHVVFMPDVMRPKTMDGGHEQDFVNWLAQRLGTDVHPPMLTRSGFELVGGRLLPDANGDVAQFMYRDAQGQRITLCVSRRKADSGTTAFRLYQDGSVNVFYWIDGDFGYAVSGGIGRDVLLELSHDVHEQIAKRGG